MVLCFSYHYGIGPNVATYSCVVRLSFGCFPSVVLVVLLLLYFPQVISKLRSHQEWSNRDCLRDTLAKAWVISSCQKWIRPLTNSFVPQTLTGSYLDSWGVRGGIFQLVPVLHNQLHLNQEVIWPCKGPVIMTFSFRSQSNSKVQRVLAYMYWAWDFHGDHEFMRLIWSDIPNI